VIGNDFDPGGDAAMALVEIPSSHLKRVIRRRRITGADRFDEVWDGVYVMSPLADNVHQDLGGGIAAGIMVLLRGETVARVQPGANVSDQDEDWTKNYRCPDVLVFLAGNPAQDRDTHWLGGPDFAVEILSKGDRARKKFAFYARVGVRELLLVDRRPWRLELYRLAGGEYEQVGTSDLEDPAILEVARADGAQRWLA